MSKKDRNTIDFKETIRGIINRVDKNGDMDIEKLGFEIDSDIERLDHAEKRDLETDVQCSQKFFTGNCVVKNHANFLYEENYE